MEQKMIIYQVFTRLFGNKGLRNKMNGTLEENGCGKMDDFTDKALHEIKKLGATHIWYTGIIAHASQTDYSAYGIGTLASLPMLRKPIIRHTAFHAIIRLS